MRVTNPVCIFGDLGYEHGNSTESIIRNGLAGKFDFIVHVGQSAKSHPKSLCIHYASEGFDLGPVHWVALSTEYYGFYDTVGKGSLLNQLNWLQKDLELANLNRGRIPWIVTYLHRPFYCSAAHSDDCTGFDNVMIRNGYDDMPGLEKPFLHYAVDLGFWGHVHYYERFYPVADMMYWDSADCYHNAVAPTYVITGAAETDIEMGTLYTEKGIGDARVYKRVRADVANDVNSSTRPRGCHSTGTKIDKTPEPFSAKRLNEYGYTILTVANATHMHIEQISLDRGEAVADDFWLSKDMGFRRQK
ncbi:hypothetical protein TELCIR_09296, partial [Teladorsagia circumcincta]